jgi:hypothetical protein
MHDEQTTPRLVAVVVAFSVAYLCLLVAVAYYGRRRAGEGRSIIGNGTVYARRWR